MEVVSVLKCEDYELTRVQDVVNQSLDSLGDWKNKIKKGSKVLIKPNLLKKNNPEDAVTTHPTVVEAVVRYFHKLECEVVIADSPGGPYIAKLLSSVYKATGMEEVAKNTGCTLNMDVSVCDVSSKVTDTLKNLKVIKPLVEVDFVVSVAKLKTHGMMTFTGAVKNLFGLITGLTKAEYHLKLKKTNEFANLIVDICNYAKPVISIIDGIEGMEGNGPSGGDKRKVGLLIASESPYALDTVAASIIGMDPLTVPTIKAAAQRGISTGIINDIEVRGEKLEELKVEPFKMPDSIVSVTFNEGKLPKFIVDYVMESARSKPLFNKNKCISCGECVKICPPQVIKLIDRKPEVDISNCISCFCCHEVCPVKAIDIKRNWLNKLLFKA